MQEVFTNGGSEMIIRLFVILSTALWGATTVDVYNHDNGGGAFRGLTLVFCGVIAIVGLLIVCGVIQ